MGRQERRMLLLQTALFIQDSLKFDGNFLHQKWNITSIVLHSRW